MTQASSTRWGLRWCYFNKVDCKGIDVARRQGFLLDFVEELFTWLKHFDQVLVIFTTASDTRNEGWKEPSSVVNLSTFFHKYSLGDLKFTRLSYSNTGCPPNHGVMSTSSQEEYSALLPPVSSSTTFAKSFAISIVVFP